MNVRDKVIVVTGGASGIGAALARRFAEEGAARVVVADLDGAVAARVADAIGEVAVPADLDVAVESDVVSLIDDTERRWGPIDLFCSNAGIFTGGGLDTADETWERMLSVNFRAHLYAARHLVPRMAERGGGYLLQTASAAGLLTQVGSVTYAVTKHAAVALAEWIAITHGEDGIRVSVVCPQAVRTPMLTSGEGSAARVDGIMEPDAVADAVVRGLAEERFLILPHPEVEKYEQRRAADRDRWLSGMRRLQARLRMAE